MSVESLDVVDLYKDALKSGTRIFGADFFGEFLNFGYWRADTTSQREACENLVELVLSFLPARRGRVLEAGCGVGGVAKYISRYFEPSAITGINIVDDQLKTCRERLPGASFQAMDAAQLTFDDASFDVVLSVESAFHYDTREQFFRQAFRVLKPGGYLALADILTRPVEGAKNQVSDLGEYASQLRAAGFVEVRVIDVTTDTMWAHLDFSLAHLEERARAGKITPPEFELAALSRLARLAATDRYVIASARKPPAQLPEWRRRNAGGTYVRELLTRTAAA